MPNYVKVTKDILSKKKRLGEFETVALIKEYSAFLDNKLPSKMKDPGSFTIPYNIGESYCGKALRDLGASINLIPMSIFKIFGIGDVRPTTVTFQLVDRSLVHLEGKIEDILRTLIDLENGELTFTMRVQDDQVTFNVPKAMKFLDPVEECSAMEKLESFVSIEWEHNSVEHPLENTLGFEPLEDEQANPKGYVRPTRFESLALETREYTQPKLSIEEPPKLELKVLLSHLKYIYLGKSSNLSMIISAELTECQEEQL
ncbi:hypothetical protein EPI10_005660 [Gossypium australe]|uniref:Uncharacterized protein n=1 Tax=Gossypium australe TaxID=47621 RepID=A0A5B6WNZ9_9ROSI|nr:hypothetical protein EPI10_005660 [Gossypium australe]